MRTIRVLAAVTVLVILTHGAAALAPFSADAVAIDGAVTLEGAPEVLFAVGDATTPFTWTLTADAAVVERVYMEWRQVRDPQGRVLFEYVDDPNARRERLEFTDVHIRSAGADAISALLARGTGLTGSVATSDRVAVDAVTDPRFDQGPPPEYDSEPSGQILEIHEMVPGEHVLVRARGASFLVQGALAVTLVGPDYTLDATEGTYHGRTGFHETRSAAAYAEGVVERQVLHLENAVLRLESAREASLLAPTARVAFKGTLLADGAAGDFPLPLPTATGNAWTGDGLLDVSPADARVALTAPAPLTAAGAASRAQLSGLLPFVLGGVGVLAVAVAGVAVARHRRVEEEDPLALALLAMEDRRFADALPLVERALARAPHDAKLLVDRGLCLEQTGRLPEAREAYEAAMRVEPFNAETHYYYARALARLQNGTGALAHLGRALSLDARLAELARRESAFAGFRDHPQFLGLLD